MHKQKSFKHKNTQKFTQNNVVFFSSLVSKWQGLLCKRFHYKHEALALVDSWALSFLEIMKNLHHSKVRDRVRQHLYIDL